jgi:hypothetical protein
MRFEYGNSSRLAAKPRERDRKSNRGAPFVKKHLHPVERNLGKLKGTGKIIAEKTTIEGMEQRDPDQVEIKENGTPTHIAN